MNETIKTQTVTAGFAKTDWIVLKQTSDTALIFKPEIHPGGVRGRLVRFKKERGKDWEQLDEQDFRKLNLYEGVEIELGTEQTKIFCEEIEKRRKIAQQGVASGYREYTVAPSDKVIVIDDANKRQVLQQVLESNYSEDFWSLLKEHAPELAKRILLNHLHEIRAEALEEFRTNLPIKGTGEEAYWQDFFERNKWIFGYGLNYQILQQEQGQPHYGGTRVDGTGEQRGDILCSTEGDIKFTVLVEIKTPQTSLLHGTSPQRNGAWSIAKQLGDGITQLQANLSTWEITGSRTDDNRDRFEENETYTVTPKGILLIGKLDEIASDRDKRNTFERFRQGIHAVEIITFDELLKRAEFILGEND